MSYPQQIAEELRDRFGGLGKAAYDLITMLAERNQKLEDELQDNGSEAYSIACDDLESWQRKRMKEGKDPGTRGSVCDGMASLYNMIEELERSPWRPMSECPDDPEMVVLVLSDSHEPTTTRASVARAFKKLKAWMPIPPMVTT